MKRVPLKNPIYYYEYYSFNKIFERQSRTTTQAKYNINISGLLTRLTSIKSSLFLPSEAGSMPGNAAAILLNNCKIQLYYIFKHCNVFLGDEIFIGVVHKLFLVRH